MKKNGSMTIFMFVLICRKVLSSCMSFVVTFLTGFVLVLEFLSLTVFWGALYML